MSISRSQFHSKIRSGLLKSCMALIAVGFAAQAANAQVEGGFLPGGPGRWAPPSGPGFHPPGMRTDSVRMTVGRQFRGFTQLDVSQLMSIATQGREVLSLSVRMNSQGGRSHAILLENGRAVGQPKIVPMHMVDLDFDVERPNVRNQLELNLNGPIYISEITATVRDFGHGHFGPIELREFVGQAYFRGAYLNIDQLVDLRSYSGRTLKKVVIRGSSRHGRGTAELVINGFGQRSKAILGSSLAEHALRVNGRSRIGYEIQSLDVEINGNVFVESVTVELE